MRFEALPRNGNSAKGGEPGRLVILEVFSWEEKNEKENFNFDRNIDFVND